MLLAESAFTGLRVSKLEGRGTGVGRLLPDAVAFGSYRLPATTKNVLRQMDERA